MTWKKDQEQRLKYLESVDMKIIRREIRKILFARRFKEDEEYQEWLIFLLKVRALREYWEQWAFIAECEEEIKRMLEYMYEEERIFQLLYYLHDNALKDFLSPVIMNMLYEPQNGPSC